MSLPVSFEFFPTKTPEGAVKLRAARQQLYVRKPEFCSVTYGAGGSTRDKTVDLVSRIERERGIDMMCHLTVVDHRTPRK